MKKWLVCICILAISMLCVTGSLADDSVPYGSVAKVVTQEGTVYYDDLFDAVKAADGVAGAEVIMVTDYVNYGYSSGDFTHYTITESVTLEMGDATVIGKGTLFTVSEGASLSVRSSSGYGYLSTWDGVDSIVNNGTLSVDGCTVSMMSNYGTAVVSSAVLNSYYGNAVTNCGTLSLDNCKVYSEMYAIYNEGDVTVNGNTTFSSMYGEFLLMQGSSVTFAQDYDCSGIYFLNGSEEDIVVSGEQSAVKFSECYKLMYNEEEADVLPAGMGGIIVSDHADMDEDGKCPVCGKCYEASLIADGKTMNFINLYEAVDYAQYLNESTTVTLLSDVEILTSGKMVFICEGKITLDLNGHTLLCENSVYDYYATPIAMNGGELTLVDTSEGKTGMITARGISENGVAGVHVMGGKFIMESGKIQITKESLSKPDGMYYIRGIQVEQGAKAHVKGGTILVESDYEAQGVYVNNGGTLTLSGGIINAVSEYEYAIVRGVQTYYRSSMTVSGGTVISTKYAMEFGESCNIRFEGAPILQGEISDIIPGSFNPIVIACDLGNAVYTVENMNYCFKFAKGEGMIPDADNFYCINEGASVLRVGKMLYLTDGYSDVPDQTNEPILVTASNYEALGLDSSYIGYYYIADADDLRWMSNAINDYYDYYAACNFVQGGMISIPPSDTYSLRSSRSSAWRPIDGFEGVYDGRGYTISGLYYNLDDYIDPETGFADGENATLWVGLFATINESGVVKNVNISDSLFSGKYVGAICGENYGTITNCSSSATIVLSGAQYVEPYYGMEAIGGGIVGSGTRGTIENCISNGKIYTGEFVFDTEISIYMGGIIGFGYNDTVKNCVSNNQMTVGNAFAGETEVRMGGIAGTCIDTQLKNCIHSGSMETTATFALRSVPSVAYYMGGIAGEASYSVIDNCYYDSDNQDVPAVGSIDEETEVSDKVAGMPTRAFMDGTVAYLLGDGFGQQIGKDAYPVFGGDRIYASTDCEGNEIFSNSEEADHIDVDGDGICDTCDTDTTINADPYDVNLDGVINISDVNDLLVYLAGSAENDDYHWDVDGNGIVNIADLNELLVELAGGNE